MLTIAYQVRLRSLLPVPGGRLSDADPRYHLRVQQSEVQRMTQLTLSAPLESAVSCSCNCHEVSFGINLSEENLANKITCRSGENSGSGQTCH